MQPRDVFLLHPEQFGDKIACREQQLVTLLRVIDEARPGLMWYGADVEAVGPLPMPRGEKIPHLVGDTESLIQAAQRIRQFESGVFAGVPDLPSEPTFRAEGLWTDDDDDADLGDAVVEMRAFDTTYWIVGTTSAKISTSLREQFEVK